MAMSRSLTVDEIDEDAWARAKTQIVSWMDERVSALKAEGQFEAAAKAITHVGLRTLEVQNGTSVAEPG
ncbi:hypothetical protein, partial [Proteus mirabilis]|uniref:hypothetical protein n=1 Tax=Proteus mirabilis TaxID=584 RepID=UPI0013D1DAC0